MRFQSLSNLGISLSGYLSVVASISEPENTTTNNAIRLSLYSPRKLRSLKQTKHKTIIKITQNCTNKRKTLKGLGYLPSNALFNVVSSTSLDLNVPKTAGQLEYPINLSRVCLD